MSIREKLQKQKIEAEIAATESIRTEAARQIEKLTGDRVQAESDGSVWLDGVRFIMVECEMSRIGRWRELRAHIVTPRRFLKWRWESHRYIPIVNRWDILDVLEKYGKS